jgi:hypothetical protein
MYCLGTNLQVTLVDSNTLVSYTTNYTVPNLAALLGNGAAYIGMTGGTGGDDAVQTVTDFTFSYTTAPTLSIAAGATPGTVAISWPISVSSLFQLMQSPNVNGPWTVAASAPFPTAAGGTQNQVTLSAGGAEVFYELQLTAPNAP